MICPKCKAEMIWNSDYAFDEVGCDGEGVMSCYSCVECGTSMDIYVPEENDGERRVEMTELEKRQQEILRSVEERIEELKNIKQMLVKCQRDFECSQLEVKMLREQNDRLMVSLRDCANDLCQKCGKYRNEHLGVCEGCKWKEVKHWDSD